MQYYPPYGSADPDASYVDRNSSTATSGSKVPAKAVEKPQREIVDVITKSSMVPAEGLQLATAIQSGRMNYAVATGTATALLAAFSPAVATLVPGLALRVKAISDATGASTINIDGLGVKAIVDRTGAPIIPGFWQSGDILLLVYDGTSVRVMGGNTVVSTTFNTSYSTPFSLSNNVVTQAALTDGSAAFGALTSNAFTFTRAGFYAVSAQVTTTVTASGAASINSGVLIRKNGANIPGGNVQDNNYAGSASTATSGAVVTVVISADVGDVLTVFAQAAANSNFTSAQLTSATLSITPIS